MLDINKMVTEERLAGRDPDGNMSELEPWSPQIAGRRAEADGIVLSDEHWAVLWFLRERYRNRGLAHSGRELLREVEAELYPGEGRKRLFELFPGGPVSQASRIAGLPLPPHSSDPSFGSVE